MKKNFEDISNLPPEDIKQLVYTQALHRLMNVKHTLEPNSAKWIYEIKELGYLLSMLTDEDLARLTKSVRPFKIPRDELFD